MYVSRRLRKYGAQFAPKLLTAVAGKGWGAEFSSFHVLGWGGRGAGEEEAQTFGHLSKWTFVLD